MKHNPGFLKLVDEVRKRVKECTVADAKSWLDRGDSLHLLMYAKTMNSLKIMRREHDTSGGAFSNETSRRSFRINRPRLFSIVEVATGRLWRRMPFSGWDIPTWSR